MMSKLYWIWLATRAGCGAAFGRQMIEYFGTPEAVWRALREEIAAVPSMTRMRQDALMDKDLTYPRRIIEDCEKQEISIVTLADPNYPALLRQINSPPLLLYVRGTLPDFRTRLAVSIVGTRKATKYGLHASRYFAGTLAQNDCIIVSGMALGIDGTANRAAIEAGGQTVAVLGCGVDVCYPWQHKQLMEDIIRHGAVISEYPPGTEPKGRHFPVRNRIITGLSRGTLVVEAPKKSGALISADLALEQGRDVFAVPADINRPNSAGCNNIIRKGCAELVQVPADILAYYGQRERKKPAAARIVPIEQRKLAAPNPLAAEEQADAAPPVMEMRRLEGSVEERAVWCAVHDGQYTVDAIVESTGLTASTVLTALTMLELGVYIIRAGDGYRAADDVEL
ncbi:MAG: DNA-processing protein DprA [Eubacteriales bacterium]|nr:DNA-processing protein DprA [Eubacteriales bacterium]